MNIQMTVRFLAAAPVAMIGLLGCDATAPDEEPRITMHGVWGGERWLGGSQARFMDSGEFAMYSWIPVDRPEMPHVIISVSTQFDGPGTYAIGASAARIDYLVGGDVLVASYGTTDVHTGTLEIDEVSTTHVRGTITVDAVTTGTHQPVGQQARFTGTFNAPLQQDDP